MGTVRKYIIDGNNLIGKDAELKKLQKEFPQKSREALVLKLSRFFKFKKVEVSLHFDGYPAEAIPSGKIRIHYSYDKTADENIRDEIDLSRNPKTVAVVSSDSEVLAYAKVNACVLIKSERFLQMLRGEEKEDIEEKLQKEIDKEELLNLFLNSEDEED